MKCVIFCSSDDQYVSGVLLHDLVFLLERFLLEVNFFYLY